MNRARISGRQVSHLCEVQNFRSVKKLIFKVSNILCSVLKIQIMHANENIPNFKWSHDQCYWFFSTLPQAQRGAVADMSANACVSSVQTIYGQLVSQVDNWKVAKHLKTVFGNTEFRFKDLGWKLISVAYKTIFLVEFLHCHEPLFLFTKMGPIALNPHFYYLKWTNACKMYSQYVCQMVNFSFSMEQKT